MRIHITCYLNNIISTLTKLAYYKSCTQVKHIPPKSERFPPLKNIGDGEFALEVECSVSDREPDKLAGLESPELTHFRPNVGVSGLNV